MTRYKAAAIHFLGSAFVLFLIFALVRWVWYPGPLFVAANGVNLVGIITAVDVVLGPLIMLIIFDTRKKSLKFDIAMVLLFQIGFMLYGSWSIFAARPVYIAFSGQQFHLVTANQIEDSDLQKAERDEFRRLPWLGPVQVGTKAPADSKKREEVMFAGLGGMGLHNLPQYYVPYADVVADIKQQARALEAMEKLSGEERQRLAEEIKQYSGTRIGLIPVSNKNRRLFAVIDQASGKMLGLL